LKDKLAKVEKHPFTDADAQQLREYVSHAACISRGRNYETDLATCREIAEGSSASGSGKELAGTGAGALAGAGAFGAPRGMPRATQGSSRAAPPIARRQRCFAYRARNDRLPHAVDQKPFQITAGCTL
jgi:hypothetical protein